MKRKRSKPVSYKDNTDSCANCTYSVCITEQDMGPSYFCSFGAPPIPKKADFPEIPFKSAHEELEFLYDLWEVWCKNRDVKPWGICDKFKQSE